MRVPKRADDFRLGRLAVRRALLRAGLAERDLARLEVRAQPDGSPIALLDGRACGFAVSISHSAGWGLAVAGAGRAALGTDLERVESRSTAFEEDYLTIGERATLACLEGERALAVTRAWSAKESALKLLGCGLRVPLQSVEVECVSLLGPGPWRELAVRLTDGRRLSGAWRADRGLVATLLTSAGGVPSIEGWS
jgi:phosphopantetheinyl transferase